jgi:hypothetical protein
MAPADPELADYGELQFYIVALRSIVGFKRLAAAHGTATISSAWK